MVAGEVFTHRQRLRLQPADRARLPYLQQFVVITGGTSAASGTASAQRPVVDHLAPDHHLRRLSNRGVRGHVLDGSLTMTRAIQWMGNDTESATASTTYRFGTVFRPEALALVSAKLIMPYSGEADFATDPGYWPDRALLAHVGRDQRHPPAPLRRDLRREERRSAPWRAYQRHPKLTATLTEAG